MTDVLPPACMAGHIAVLGMTGSGKSNSARVVVEHGYEMGDHICIFDTVKSDWRGIVSSFDGLEPGLPFTILGGPFGHVPLHPGAGAQIAELVASGALPYSVLDTRQFPMGGLQRFYNDFAPVILDRNRHVLRLVFEEAHELAPKEKAGISGENMGVYFTKKLATAGRSQGLRLMFNTQRVQSLHNAALGSCSTVIAHRLQYPADQVPVVKWLAGTVKDKAKVKEIDLSMSELADGEAWVCSGIGSVLERRQMPRMHTFDSGATPKHGEHQRQPKVAAKVDVEKLRALLDTTVAEAEESDVPALKAQIKELKAKLAGSGAHTAADIVEARQTGERSGYQRGREEGHARGWQDCEAAHHAARAAVVYDAPWPDDVQPATMSVCPPGQKSPETQRALEQMGSAVARALKEPAAGGGHTRRMRSPEPLPAGGGPGKSETRNSQGAAGSSTIGNGALRRVLTALAQLQPENVRPRKLAILADVIEGGSTWREVFARCRRDKYVDEDSDGVRITQAGLEALGEFEPLPTGKALRNHWRAKIGGGDKRLAIFEAVLDAYPDSIHATDAAAAAGVEHGGSSWREHMARLRALELVSGSELLRAAPELFQ